MVEPRSQITFAQTSYSQRIEQTCECVKRLAPFVDRIVIVENDYTSEDCEKVRWASKDHVFQEDGDTYKVQLIHKPWIDHFSAYRNRYLSAVNDGWVLVSDPDEWFSPDACKSLRELVQDSKFGSAYNVVAFNAVDTFYSDDYKTKLASNRSQTWFKQLFFKYYPGMYYSGAAHGIVHEQLIHPPNLRVKAINASPECYYEHVKSKFEQTERGVRNFWIGGGGINDMGQHFPDWKMLKERLWLDNQISSWHEFQDYLKAGKIAEWLKTWIREHEHYEDPPNSVNPLASEVRELYLLYFEYFHPEEKL